MHPKSEKCLRADSLLIIVGFMNFNASEFSDLLRYFFRFDLIGFIFLFIVS